MGGRWGPICALLLAGGLAACSGSGAPTATPSPAPVTSAPVPRSSPTPSPTPPRGAFTLAVAGDVHFEGAVRQRLLADPRTAFGPIAPALRRADLTVVNLETAITERGTPVPGKEYVFRAPESAYRALKAAGVDVASLANNHGMDFGQVGLQDTLSSARAARFPLVGAGADEDAAYAPYLRTVKGWRVAVLGATQVLDNSVTKAWTATTDQAGLASAKREDRLVRAVRETAARADVVVVFLHWGVERSECPSGDQKRLAERLAAAGADVVVGAHAHVVQGAGFLGRTFVHYGLGNFLFYARGDNPTTLTSVVTLTVDGGRVTRVERTPARLRNGRTAPLEGDAARREVERQEGLRSCTGLSARPGR